MFPPVNVGTALKRKKNDSFEAVRVRRFVDSSDRTSGIHVSVFDYFQPTLQLAVKAMAWRLRSETRFQCPY